MTDRDDAVLYMWTIYDHPRDMPNKFIARRWAIVRGQDPKPTAHYFAADELDAVRAFLISKHLTRIDRSEYDDPVIVETWL